MEDRPGSSACRFVPMQANTLQFVKQSNRWLYLLERPAGEVGLEGFEDQHPVGSVIQCLKAIPFAPRFAERKSETLGFGGPLVTLGPRPKSPAPEGGTSPSAYLVKFKFV